MRALRLQLAIAHLRTADPRLPFSATATCDIKHAKTVSNSSIGLFGHRLWLPLTPMNEIVRRSPKLVAVSERNLQSAAIRLLPKNNKLVSTEVDYLRRVLGDKATQNDIDEKVVLVRRLPWREIVGE